MITAPVTTDTRVASFSPLPSPSDVVTDLPLTERHRELVDSTRRQVEAILAGEDSRLLVVVGPCSVHDPLAALEYARRLAVVADRFADSLLIVMRVYFEKPRSTGGWKGLINDPGLDGSHRVVDGLHIARRLLLDVLDLGLPVGCEFLEPTTPQYIADAVSWGAIGARTTESQIHRQLASGLSMPVGFKNGSDGDVQVAVDGCTVASRPQTFFGMDDEGRASVVATTGNEAAHVILRGGRGRPNYGSADIRDAVARLEAAGFAPSVVVDASHANSGKDHVRQIEVVREIGAARAAGEPIVGLMIESFLVPGAQSLTTREDLVFGQSITDACIGWADTERLLSELAALPPAR